jgi:nucleotide-binding universal stress UspA family protein
VPPVAEFAGPVDTGWVTALEAQRRRDLNVFAEREQCGLDVERIVVTGDPAGKIVEYARQRNTDLIMMPTHGYGPFRRFLIGSVAAKWTAAHLPASGRHPRPIASILGAIDNGPASEAVLRWASSFATSYGALLTTAHAIPTIQVAEGYLDPEVRRNRVAAAELTGGIRSGRCCHRAQPG